MAPEGRTVPGWITSEGLVEGLRQGHIHGLVSQDPFDMGYRGVLTAVAVLKGETVEKRVATRLAVITPDNIDDADMKELIEPDLATWLE